MRMQYHVIVGTRTNDTDLYSDFTRYNAIILFQSTLLTDVFYEVYSSFNISVMRMQYRVILGDVLWEPMVYKILLRSVARNEIDAYKIPRCTYFRVNHPAYYATRFIRIKTSQVAFKTTIIQGAHSTRLHAGVPDFPIFRIRGKKVMWWTDMESTALTSRHICSVQNSPI